MHHLVHACTRWAKSCVTGCFCLTCWSPCPPLLYCALGCLHLSSSVSSCLTCLPCVLLSCSLVSCAAALVLCILMWLWPSILVTVKMHADGHSSTVFLDGCIGLCLSLCCSLVLCWVSHAAAVPGSIWLSHAVLHGPGLSFS